MDAIAAWYERYMRQPDYPAAHSMDTTWFAVDLEGHVALFDSGEPCPVPFDVAVAQGRQEADLATVVSAIRTRRDRPARVAGIITPGAIYDARPRVVGGKAEHGAFNSGPRLVFLDDVELVRDDLNAGRAQRVRTRAGYAVVYDKLTDEITARLHDGPNAPCRGCILFPDRREDYELQEPWNTSAGPVAEAGLFVFGEGDHHDAAWPLYQRTALPTRPVLVSELPPEARAVINRDAVKLPVRFDRISEVQPAEHVHCEVWGGGQHPALSAIDGLPRELNKTAYDSPEIELSADPVATAEEVASDEIFAETNRLFVALDRDHHLGVFVSGLDGVVPHGVTKELDARDLEYFAEVDPGYDRLAELKLSLDALLPLFRLGEHVDPEEGPVLLLAKSAEAAARFKGREDVRVVTKQPFVIIAGWSGDRVGDAEEDDEDPRTLGELFDELHDEGTCRGCAPIDEAVLLAARGFYVYVAPPDGTKPYQRVSVPKEVLDYGALDDDRRDGIRDALVRLDVSFARDELVQPADHVTCYGSRLTYDSLRDGRRHRLARPQQDDPPPTWPELDGRS